MKKSQIFLNKKLLIFLFLTFIFIISACLFFEVKDSYQVYFWKTFNSNRVGLSFKYPKNWPVSSASDSELQESNKLTSEDELELENIDFQEEWNRAAGGPRLGWISIRKLKDTSTLDDYIKEIDKETVIEAHSAKFTVPAPEITFTTIGSERAVLVKDKSTAASFSRNIFDYRVVKDGLLYRFVASASDQFLEDKEKNSEIFQKIILTVRLTH